MTADLVQHGLSSWWAPVLAFAAGVISFASPCVYPLVPGYLAFVTGSQEEGRKPLTPILMFIVVSFATILGIAYLLQRQRNKLRGSGTEHRTGGYR